MVDEKININTNLYSRQIGTYGLNTMTKLSKLNIFIYGMRGIGVEIAKNVILAGPKRVTIYDNNISKINDLTSNFYINEKDVSKGKRRDEACFSNLNKLNPYVKLNIMKDESIIEHIKKKMNIEDEKYNVVIISEFMPKHFIIELNNLCRENTIGFIYGSELGINGFCFVDFGDNFKIYEKDNEEPKKFIINSITKGKPGIVTLVNPINRVFLKDKDYVTFQDINGMTELNNCSPIQIKIIDKYKIEIPDTSNFSNYISSGIMIKIIKFESFEKKIEEPYDENDGYLDQFDFGKQNTNEILHIGLLGLFNFYNKKKCLPEINNNNDAKELTVISKKILEEKEKQELYWVNNLRTEINNFEKLFEKTIKNLSFWSRVQISPISSFLGGLIAQEIVKYTGKFIPIKQWVWFDFSEIVENLNNNIDRHLSGTRYDDQIAIFGNELQKKLEETNIFMIGAGALGCEFLKTFSSMGIASDKNKRYKVTVTDNDNIVESNLNRQFLFRKENIGESKSKIACKSVLDLNPFFNCIDLQTRICKESEKIFNHKFWKKQNFIINAVDNIEARIYINEQCKKYKKILIDSGTNGTKANSQIIIPFKTRDYIPEKDDYIPLCTINDSPSKIDHCIIWALNNFNSYFVDIINKVKLFIEDRESFYELLDKQGLETEQMQLLKKIIRYLKILINKDFNECLKIALEEYYEAYYNSINRKLSNNPQNSLNSDGSGNKRFLNPLRFDIDNELAFLFVKNYSIILANSISIPVIDNNDYIKNKILELESSIFKFEIVNIGPIKKYKRYENLSNNNYISPKLKLLLEREKKNESEQRRNIYIQEFIKTKEEANNLNISKIKKNINNIFINQELKKNDDDEDNDENIRIDFIFAASNLRAQVFKIEKENKINIKLKIRKIIPSIAATTASIVGLVSLQLYTLYQTNDIKYLRDDSFNFSINAYEFNYPTIYQEDQQISQERISKIKIIKNNLFNKTPLKKLIKSLIKNNKCKENIVLISSNNIRLKEYCKNELGKKKINFNYVLLSKYLILILIIFYFLYINK